MNSGRALERTNAIQFEPLGCEPQSQAIMLYTQPSRLHSTSIHVAGDGNPTPECKLPFVSVVVPCRNEERYIARCLDSLLASDYPEDRLEIIVVDGLSTDGTRDILAEYVRRYDRVRMVDNPRCFIPAAMNIGGRCARGDIIMKIDCHSVYPAIHVSRCVQHLMQTGAHNVGGVIRLLPSADTDVARIIPLVLGHRFGSGNAYIKVGGLTGPSWTDAVAFGCYPRAVLDRLGWFNEDFIRSSDMDMNVRIRAAGGSILLLPEIVLDYYADATFQAMWKHSFADGFWATYVLRLGTRAFSWRHWVPFLFVASMITLFILSWFSSTARLMFAVLGGTYFLANFAASAHIAWQDDSFRHLFLAPVAFTVRHFAHGLGALTGFVRAFLPARFNSKLPTTRSVAG